MSESRNTFFETVTVNADGTQKVVYSNSTTVTGRSQNIYCPADSSLAIHISGTATVQVISNPFGESSKDFVLDTVTSTNQFNMPTARQIVLNVTAISGTVTAIIVANED